MDVAKKIAENIRLARGDLSRQKLAEKISLTYQTVYEIEEGRRKPSIDALIVIAEVLGVSAASLLETDRAPTVVYLPVSETLTKLASVPDDIYEMASRVGKESAIWETVRTALEVEIERLDEAKKSKKA